MISGVPDDGLPVSDREFGRERHAEALAYGQRVLLALLLALGGLRSAPGWYTFVNDGDQTAPGGYVQIDPGPGQTFLQWQAHNDGSGVYWDADIKWGYVDGATEYDFTLQPLERCRTLRCWKDRSGFPALSHTHPMCNR